MRLSTGSNLGPLTLRESRVLRIMKGYQPLSLKWPRKNIVKDVLFNCYLFVRMFHRDPCWNMDSCLHTEQSKDVYSKMHMLTGLV